MREKSVGAHDRVCVCVCLQLIIQQDTMAVILTDSGYLSHLWAWGILGITHLYAHLTTTHSLVWHHLMRPAVGYEGICLTGEIVATFVKKHYWALQATWMFRVGVNSSWSDHCEMVLLSLWWLLWFASLFLCNTRAAAVKWLNYQSGFRLVRVVFSFINERKDIESELKHHKEECIWTGLICN